MDYDFALDFGQRIMARERKAGKADDVVRDFVYNGIICMACDGDKITPKAERLAKRVVKPLMPGPVKVAGVVAKIEPINK